MRRRHVFWRVFRCMECGTTAVIPKYSRATSKGHKKHMYCYRCQAVTGHVQISK